MVINPEHVIIAYAASTFIFVVVLVVTFIILRGALNKDARAQRELNEYLQRSLSPEEIGKLYERYIGYLYENMGYEVEYCGALNGYKDLGRDLVAKKEDQIVIVQAKCWAKNKLIQAKHIFQLYGTKIHFRRITKEKPRSVRAVFYTTASFSDDALEVARVLGVELRKRKLDRSYPMIKCAVGINGEKVYYLPFDPEYDRLRIDPQRGDFFARTVKEAAAKGFRRLPKCKNVA